MKINTALKMLMFLIILLIIATTIYSFIYIYKIYPNLPHTDGIVVSVSDNTIIIKEDIDTTQIKYVLDLRNFKPIISDINRNIIKPTDLNVGDKIYITYKTEKMINAVAIFPPRIDNIKFIQVTEDNSNKHLTEYDTSYNNFRARIMKYTNNNIQLYINLGLSSLSDNFPSSTKCKIVQKVGNDLANYTDILNIDSSKISLESILPSHEYLINIDTSMSHKEFNDYLQPGFYIFIFDNEELGSIRIPFSKMLNNLPF